MSRRQRRRVQKGASLQDQILLAVRAMELAEAAMLTAALALRQQNADNDASIAAVLSAACDRLSLRREEFEQAVATVRP